MIFTPFLHPRAVADRRPAAYLDAERRAADRFVIALVGLAFEALIASGPGVVVICRNSEREFAAALDHALKRGCRSIISFGVAGGLAPHLRPGNWVVASSIVDAQQNRPTDQVWSEKILAMIPGAEYRPIAGVDSPVAAPRRNGDCMSKPVRLPWIWSRISSPGSLRPTA